MWEIRVKSSYCSVTSEMLLDDLGASLTTTKAGGTLETVASVPLRRTKHTVQRKDKFKPHNYFTQKAGQLQLLCFKHSKKVLQL